MSEERSENSRRSFLKSTLVAISTATLSSGVRPLMAEDGQASATEQGAKPHRFLNQSERTFLKAAVDRLIPPDGRWPGAAQAGVVDYIDLQMGGAWGRGEMLYRHGPFRKGTPSQGFQLEYTPAELFRRSISAINSHFSSQGTSFDHLNAEQQDAYLTSLEKGESDLDGVLSNVFFGFLLKHTVEGFFADPIYGGNKNKVGWKMLGFPGVYTDYYDLVDKHGIEFHREPMGIGEGTISHSMSSHMERS
jgi:gluconate 2-dehydrogenase gamma chain